MTGWLISLHSAMQDPDISTMYSPRGDVLHSAMLGHACDVAQRHLHAPTVRCNNERDRSDCGRWPLFKYGRVERLYDQVLQSKRLPATWPYWSKSTLRWRYVQLQDTQVCLSANSIRIRTISTIIKVTRLLLLLLNKKIMSGVSLRTNC